MKLQLSDAIQLMTLATAIGGIVLVVSQLRILNRQLKLQIYADYTKRYQEIILHFPEDINSPSFSLDGRSDYEKTMRYMRVYFDLCYEEWDLYRKGLIPNDLWSSWEAGMKTAMTKTAFKQAWDVVEATSYYGGVFESFMQQMESRS